MSALIYANCNFSDPKTKNLRLQYHILAFSTSVVSFSPPGLWPFQTLEIPAGPILAPRFVAALAAVLFYLEQ